jgi:hypothetical protein
MSLSFIEKDARRKIGLVIVISLFVFSGLLTVSVESAQTGSIRKPTSTPKKNASPTPKKTQAKTTPTPKKKTTATKTKAEERKQTANTAKNTTVIRDKKGGKTTVEKKPEAAIKNAKPLKNNGKNTLSKDIKKTNTKTNTPQPKTSIATKNTTQPKTVTKPQTLLTNKKELPQVIVTAFSVPIRNEARQSASTVSRAKLGSVLKVMEKNSAWYKVQLTSGGKTSSGWVAVNAVSDLGTVNKQRLYWQIVEKNYQPEMTFATASEMYEFLTEITGELDSSDTSAQIELQRLRSLQMALKNISASQKDKSPYKEFLKTNEKAIVYSEPAGKFLVASNQFWELHAKYRKSVISDKIAWEAALNPLPGECEGYVNCYLFDMRMRFGEYLNYHPKGEKAMEALTNLTNYLEPIVADAQEKTVYNGPTDVTDRAEFNNLIAELRTIVARLPFMEKEKTLRQLKIIAEAYR